MMPFNPKAVWEEIMSGRLTVFMAVPTVYAKLIQTYEGFPEETQKEVYVKAKQLRLMVSGSAALPEPVADRWQSITGHRLLERYGMTEIGMALSNPLSPVEDRIPGYVGKPLPGVQTKIIPNSEAEESQNDRFVIGELFVKGPQIFKGYYNLPEVTKKAFDADGWFETGDVVRFDREREIYKIEGRHSVDILKSGGYKISALDIERELLSLPNLISEVAVIGVPDPVWGQIICAIVVAREDVDGNQINELLLNKLASYKIPRKYAFVKSIPRNAMGKVNKKDLLKWWLSTQS
eukprot:TRINITY_DN3045_c0_g2_i8.p1 TRINITY_DN3045_c0_g2~~TRINITY_DN3045_c0_g2_i8.p1  ORF type:complete len:292 (-),score=57.96 TRINITY_DN3045_c0_g2_i8:119-994(-)